MSGPDRSLLQLPWRLTAAEIASKIYTRLEPDTPVGDVDWATEPRWRYLEDRFALVERGREVLGLVFALDFAEGPKPGSIGQYAYPFKADQVISAETPLQDTLRIWTEKDQYLYFPVLSGKVYSHVLFR